MSWNIIKQSAQSIISSHFLHLLSSVLSLVPTPAPASQHLAFCCHLAKNTQFQAWPGIVRIYCNRTGTYTTIHYTCRKLILQVISQREVLNPLFADISCISSCLSYLWWVSLPHPLSPLCLVVI